MYHFILCTVCHVGAEVGAPILKVNHACEHLILSSFSGGIFPPYISPSLGFHWRSPLHLLAVLPEPAIYITSERRLGLLSSHLHHHQHYQHSSTSTQQHINSSTSTQQHINTTQQSLNMSTRTVRLTLSHHWIHLYTLSSFCICE
jgi:hypothetical protein